jgi:hypothetical protein
LAVLVAVSSALAGTGAAVAMAIFRPPAGVDAAHNLIKYGGFESPVVPAGSFQDFSMGQTFSRWTVVGASGNVAIVSGTFMQNGFSFPARSGKQWLDLTGTSQTATGVQQNVNTTPATNYRLSFWVGNVCDPGGIFGTTSTVNVVVNGGAPVSKTNRHCGGMSQVWQKFSITFAASSTQTTIAFINGDPSSDTSNGLDAVKMVAIARNASPLTDDAAE